VKRAQDRSMVSRIWYSLYDRMLSERALRKAFWRVRSAKGAAGIDGQSINDFAEMLGADIGRNEQHVRVCKNSLLNL
jgi:hypothetical protein